MVIETKCKSQPLSRQQLRQMAIMFRRVLNIDHVLRVNVLRLLELVMPLLDEHFSYEIVPVSAMPRKRHADTDVVNRIIRIREDIYMKACNGDGQARMTIMHEIAHYLLIVIYGVKFARSFGAEQIKPFEDPEWQAKALAGEIMCDSRLIRNMTQGEIKKQCGVSWSAAQQAYKNCRKP